MKFELSNDLVQEIIKMRRHLHRNPEVSGEEQNTAKFISSKLNEYGIPFVSGIAGNGIKGIVDGGKSGPTVALRADIDALPINEKTSCEFKSNNDGVMHACGHDAHTAMLLGAAKLLIERKEQISGRILLVFQPSEENAPVGGAQPMMDDGLFDDDEPDAIFGQHVWPDLPVGQIGISDREMMGASDRFKVTFKGKGGHASMPHQTTDAIMIANTAIMQLQSIVSRNIDPLQSAVLTVGKIEAGYRYNVIADRAVIEGTIRTFDPTVRKQMKERFHQVIKSSSSAMGGEAVIDYVEGYPATINHERWAKRVRETARKHYGEEAVPSVNPSLGGEDFSRYLKQYPGAFFWLGVMPDNEKPFPLHDPYFELNEKALTLGVEMLANVAIDALEELNVT
ncbi:M20 metallopeptidase family protein [Guptibacillus algicola]|uniref:M20 metallopeptidase family protein n=1 Tax=Guptibacillus algicola TaxID=225844 RepID=UPI001CD7A5F0|nr:M20 family metallopeptidase [Alkalihalobacillus algicola]MCA0985721.1 M20 family metallopeptidase [Alkalihalobacillus algicola]